jgi:hypothetical protein
MKRLRIEALSFVAYFLLVSLLVVVFNINLFFSTLMYFLPITIYLGFKYKKIVGKLILFLLTILAIGGVIEYFAIKTSTWYVPSSFLQNINHFIGIGGAVLEEFVWAVLAFPSFILIYKNFLDSERESERIEKSSFVVLLVSVIFVIIMANIRNVILPFLIDYYFIKIGIIIILCDILLFYRIRYKFKKILRAVVIFSPWLLIYEIVAMKNSFWIFPGKYILTWNVFGGVLPLEEVIFWVVFGVVSVILFYENFFK